MLPDSPSEFSHRAFLRAGESCLQRLGDRFRDVAFDRENVGQLAIESFGPEVRIARSVYELDIHAHWSSALHAPLENMRHPELASDLREDCPANS